MGDGGEIVVWSDIHKSNSKTTVKGTLKAEGGKIKGNGGRIETSGRTLDIDDITISTKSTDGLDGHWLIDPYNITISSGSDTNISGSFSATNDDAIINVGTLETALSSSNVTVTTAGGGFQSGDITVDASLTSSSNTDLTITTSTIRKLSDARAIQMQESDSGQDFIADIVLDVLDPSDQSFFSDEQTSSDKNINIQLELSLIHI